MYEIVPNAVPGTYGRKQTHTDAVTLAGHYTQLAWESHLRLHPEDTALDEPDDDWLAANGYHVTAVTVSE